MPKTCTKDGCTYNVFSSGYCQFHQYLRADFKQVSLKRVPLKRTPLKRVAQNTIKKKSDGDFQALIGELDTLVSIYVRRRNAAKNGLVGCFTCNIRRHWKEMQCGHFIPRGCMRLRFETEFNCNPQCITCNEGLSGNLFIYAQKLNEKKEGIAQELLRQSKSIFKWSRSELVDKICEMKLLIKQLPY